VPNPIGLVRAESSITKARTSYAAAFRGLAIVGTLLLASCGSSGKSGGGADDCSSGCKLIPADVLAGDTFGFAAALDGDALVIGSAATKDDVNSVGAAYIYRLQKNGWRLEDKLVADDGGAFDLGGSSVAISGDVVVIGVSEDDSIDETDPDVPIITPNLGSAYVYRFDGDVWTQEQKLEASDMAATDFFATSVSISGSVIASGAPFNDDTAVSTGSVYMFRYDGATWIEEAKLNADDATASDQFGTAVALDGEVLAVGAPIDSANGFLTGSTYVFRYDGADWNQEQKLVTDDAAAFDIFGTSLDISGDVIVVSALLQDEAGQQAGAVYVYRYNEDSIPLPWVFEKKLLASDASAFDYFGSSVTVDGDTIVVGAILDDDGGSRSGAAYVFRYDAVSKTWAQDEKLTARDGDTGDNFGSAVSIQGETVVIGAAQDQDQAPGAGSAYVFDL
jgi:hypothetical protein